MTIESRRKARENKTSFHRHKIKLTVNKICKTALIRTIEAVQWPFREAKTKTLHCLT